MIRPPNPPPKKRGPASASPLSQTPLIPPRNSEDRRALPLFVFAEIIFKVALP
jgi:hypothetical protein